VTEAGQQKWVGEHSGPFPSPSPCFLLDLVHIITPCLMGDPAQEL